MEKKQLYLQLVEDGYCLFSWPPAVDLPMFWSDNIDGEPQGDLTHNPMFQETRRFKKMYINMLQKDLQFSKDTITTISYPLMVDKTFWGVMFFEIEQPKSFNASMIPELFWLYNTIFVQIIHPVTLVEGGTGKVLFEHNKEPEDFAISQDPKYLSIIEQM